MVESFGVTWLLAGASLVRVRLRVGVALVCGRTLWVETAEEPSPGLIRKRLASIGSPLTILRRAAAHAAQGHIVGAGAILGLEALGKF